MIIEQHLGLTLKILVSTPPEKKEIMMTLEHKNFTEHKLTSMNRFILIKQRRIQRREKTYTFRKRRRTLDGPTDHRTGFKVKDTPLLQNRL